MKHEFIKLFELVVGASLINNFVFTRFLGLCIFFGVSKRMETAAGMSATFTAVMMISAALSWAAFRYVLVPFNLEFLKIVVFIGIIAALVQASDTIMRKIAPALFRKLGIMGYPLHSGKVRHSCESRSPARYCSYKHRFGFHRNDIIRYT